MTSEPRTTLRGIVSGQREFAAYQVAELERKIADLEVSAELQRQSVAMLDAFLSDIDSGRAPNEISAPSPCVYSVEK